MEGGTGGVEGGFMQETLARSQPEMEHFALGLNCLNCTGTQGRHHGVADRWNHF